MRMYLRAKSDKALKFTPEWIVLETEENSLCFDIRGWVSLNEESGGLDCTIKGDLSLWTEYDEDSDTFIDCSVPSKNQKALTDKDIYKMFENAKSFTVGIYPCYEFSDVERDSEYQEMPLSSGEGTMQLGENSPITFEFNTEINI